MGAYVRQRDHDKTQTAAACAAAERRAIRLLIKRIFAEAGAPPSDTLADWLNREPPANEVRQT